MTVLAPISEQIAPIPRAGPSTNWRRLGLAHDV